MGTDGIILTSRDGVKWELQNTSLEDLYKVIWDGERFWTVGRWGSMATSTDGETWTVIPNEEIAKQTASSSWDFMDILYVNNQYYVVGGGNYGPGLILQSDDGKHWRIVEKNPGDVYKLIASNGELLVAVTGNGYTARSRDGVHWIFSDEKNRIPGVRDIVWDGNRFLLFGYRNIHVSQDGVTWKYLDEFVLSDPETGENQNLFDLDGILHDGTRLLAINERNEVITSEDFVHWTLSDQPALIRYMDRLTISYAEGKYFISTDDDLLVSEDGENWTNLIHALVGQVGHDYFSISRVGWTGTEYIATGANFFEAPYFFRSKDGSNWLSTQVEIEGLADNSVIHIVFHTIDYLGGRFVLTGECYLLEDKPKGEERHTDRIIGFVAASDDGVRWTVVDRFFQQRMNRLAYGNGNYILVATKMKLQDQLFYTDGGVIYTSTDLKEWTEGYTTDGDLGIAHWNGRQYVVEEHIEGHPGVLISTDGHQWSRHALPDLDPVYLDFYHDYLVWNGSYYLGVNSRGDVSYSIDGKMWFDAGAPEKLNDADSLVWDGSKFLIGGDSVYIGIPTSSVEDKAAALEQAGLLRGGGNGFDLERVPTRAETAVMLVRLMGKEAEALARKYSYPFTDVPDWASPHIGYLYHHGLTKGVSGTRYGSSQAVDINMFATLLLRLMGYREDAGDFDYEQAAAAASKLGIAPGQYDAENEKSVFLRGHMVDMAFQVLFAKLKDKDQLVIDKLLDEKVMTHEAKALLEELTA